MTNEGNDTVSVIDTATNTVTDEVEVGISPVGIALSPDGTKAYVANYDDNTTSVIDTATNEVTANVSVGIGPSEIAIGKLINPSPANFKINVTKGYAPLSVQFTDLSENATAWNWDFGDGTNTTEQNATHTYSTAGIYTVNLTVSTANGTASKTATIEVQKESSSSGGRSSSRSSGSTLKIVSNDQNSSVISGSTSNTTETTSNTTETETVTQPESNIQGFEQKNETTDVNVEQKSEQTQSPNTSGSESIKAPSFEIIYGIICLLAVFLHKRK